MKKILLAFAIMTFSAQAAETDLYNFLWLDPDKSVYVLQNKIHEKNQRFYFQAGYLNSLSSDFQDSSGLNLNIGRYFHEEFAVEMTLSQYSNENNNTYESIIRVNNTEPFIRRFKRSIGVMGIWSPFYGKINTFNKIWYFDVSFGLGLANLNTESNLNYVANSTTFDLFDKESYTALTSKVDFKLHFNQNVFIETQIFGHTINAVEPQTNGSKKITNFFDLIVGLGYTF